MSPAHTTHLHGLTTGPRSALTLATLVLLVGAASSARANINIVFDYTYDTNNFFSLQSRKDVLEAAAQAFESRLTDTLTAITSGGPSTFNIDFFNPADPFGLDLALNSFSIAANDVRVFVGGSNLGGALGVGGPGGFSSLGLTSLQAARNQVGATGAAASRTDVGPWGGSIGFDNLTTWYFDADTSTTEAFPGLFDFYSVAVHELGHVLGMGTSNSWDNRISGVTFNGTAAGTQTVTGDGGHWVTGTMSTVGVNPQAAAMTPSIAADTRKYFTTLDYAGLDDIGWDVSPIPEPATWLLWGAGGALLAGLRRRRARATAQAD